MGRRRRHRRDGALGGAEPVHGRRRPSGRPSPLPALRPDRPAAIGPRLQRPRGRDGRPRRAGRTRQPAPRHRALLRAGAEHGAVPARRADRGRGRELRGRARGRLRDAPRPRSPGADRGVDPADARSGPGRHRADPGRAPPARPRDGAGRLRRGPGVAGRLRVRAARRRRGDRGRTPLRRRPQPVRRRRVADRPRARRARRDRRAAGRDGEPAHVDHRHAVERGDPARPRGPGRRGRCRCRRPGTFRPSSSCGGRGARSCTSRRSTA